MEHLVTGLHHVTAIAGDPRENLEFYTRVLGLRLVKRSVNQDAPDTYHLFYADGEGRPGTDLTFFPLPGRAPARRGAGHPVEVGYSVPEGALGFWGERLSAAGMEVGDPVARFGELTLEIRDPHGLALFLTETADPLETAPWEASPVPGAMQLRGLHSVRLLVRDLGPSQRMLSAGMGFRLLGEKDGWHRFEAGEGGPGRRVDVAVAEEGRSGSRGVGGIHHVAFRVGTDRELLEARRRVQEHGASPTSLIDRFWFHSVYFQEPGGVLFELATEGPGFSVDEEPDRLGERLVLPPWLEPKRDRIEAALPGLGGKSDDQG